MNSKMTINSHLSITQPKKMKTKTKQISRTGTESEKLTSHGGFSERRGGGEWGRGRYKE